MSSPLISVMIPSFNRMTLLKETLDSVMNAYQEWMEVVVVDDASDKEHPEQVIAGYGDNRIELMINEKNLGQINNLNRCIALARGEWIHLLHSDDIVLPDFYSAMRKAILQFPESGAIFCRHQCIDSEKQLIRISEKWLDRAGLIPDWQEKIAIRQCIQTPSIIVKKEVYMQSGGFNQDLSGCEDWEMWHRITQQHDVVFLPDILCQYRESLMSNSGDAYHSGRFISDLQTAIQLIYAQHGNYDWYKRSIVSYNKFIIDKFFEIQAKSEVTVSQLIRWWRVWKSSLFFTWKKVPAMIKLSGRVLFKHRSKMQSPE